MLAGLDERVEIQPIVADGPKVRTSYAHDQFHSWTLAEGCKRETLPAINGFVQCAKANAAGERPAHSLAAVTAGGPR